MKLLELRANKTSFHTVTFNPIGLSIIVGKKEAESSDTALSNKKKTYNSVGKSLIVCLVHFCLGSNANEELKSKLPDWEFYLDFEIGGQKFTASRNTSSQEGIVLNEERLSLTNFRKKLQDLCFQVRSKVNYLTFRSLISRFIRPKKNSYSSYDEFVAEEEDYPRLLNNAFLLGLDIERVVKKFNLKAEYDDVDKHKKIIEGDPILQSFFKEGKDIDIELVDLEDKVKRLNDKVDKFIVAEDYYQIKKDADEILAQLNYVRNQAILKDNMLRNIQRSLEEKLDVSNKNILDLYGNVSSLFGKEVIRKLQDVEEFNKKLFKSRHQRLLEGKKKIEDDLKGLEVSIKSLGKLKDEKIQYLNSRGALDEYVALNKQLSDYKIRLEKLQTYKDLINKYKNELESKKTEFSQENIAANNYLVEAKPIIHQNILIFKSYAEQFYENKKAGIEVANNEGQNKQRFEINAKIQDDAGDGVNEVKIFCFDSTLLKTQHNHCIKFLFHDGRILSDMDPRQRATLFQIAYKNAVEEKGQYIISVNQDVLDSIKEVLPDEQKDILEKNVILELTDKSNESKLLGIQVDMDYEERKKAPKIVEEN